jgi:hypothetical protein
MTLRQIAAILTGIIGIVLSCTASTPAAPPAAAPAPVQVSIGHEVGDRIPSFEMGLADGSVVASAELLNEGRPVFLFFMATW